MYQICQYCCVSELRRKVNPSTTLSVLDVGIGPVFHQEDDHADVALSDGPVEGSGNLEWGKR